MHAHHHMHAYMELALVVEKCKGTVYMKYTQRINPVGEGWIDANDCWCTIAT